MKPEDLKPKDLQNVHKLVYLANEYQKENIRELGEMFSMTMLDINATIWRARDLGYMIIDDSTGVYKVDTEPEKWQFGAEVEELCDTLLYVFAKLAERETDLEDQEFGQWCAGHLTHDVAVATKKLLNNRQLASYELTTLNEQPVSKKAAGRGKKPKTLESTYTFYTLWENMEQRWGSKRFKDQSKLK